MPTKIQRWGNSQGVRLSRDVLADARLDVGDAVDVRAVDGTIVLTPVRRVRGRVSLAALVARVPEEPRPVEVDWEAPEGDEAW